MKKFRVQLTPVGHYFLGGERGFGYDDNLKRLMSDRYFISSLKVPSQTTLFGVLRYLIGVKDEKLKEDHENLIGKSSFDITQKDNNYGMITEISPLYLYNDGTEKSDLKGYYIRTPFDHKIANYTDEGGKEKRIENEKYTPMVINKEQKICGFNYPDETSKNMTYPKDYRAKDGIAHSYTMIENGKIVEEKDIFKSSVEVVSRKSKSDNVDGFAKKEYMRLQRGWSFVFFTELETEQLSEYNRSVVMGKDSSVFKVSISEGEEPDVKGLFIDKDCDFHYCQSPVYITDTNKVSDVINNSRFSIIESESARRFKTENSKLQPVQNAALIQLISAGSVFYSDDISMLKNDHAFVAGFNRIIDGGRKK